MKHRLSLFIYSVICNIPVCFILALVPTLLALTSVSNGVMTIRFSDINWANFWMGYPLSFAIALLICNFIPLTRIGKWFAGLFHLKTDTYKGNMPYRMVASLIISAIYFIIISPTMTVFNFLVFHTPKNGLDCFLTWLWNAPIIFVIGYFTSLICDYISTAIVRIFDKEF